MTEETIFARALERGTKAERAAFLDGACAGDEALRRRVEALLESHEDPEFLGTPAVERAAKVFGGETTLGMSEAAAVEDPTIAGRPGAVIGPYKLLQEIGEGGMGTVFMAEQTRPVRRTVAVKLVKAGLDSRQVLNRFEAERQALALMDHPHIAKVLDAGATEQGRPYFVMELVKGIPITRYCDEHRLTPHERLELFLPVCAAVQHAHQKGIVHRDLKPSNVLVGLYDGQPVPKIIDFGVAKAMDQKLTEQTLFTGFGAVIGTPEYMSPEQAQLDNVDIDTRSDVYSLGILLYELLTGTTPLQHRRVQQAAVLEVLRLVREEEPPRPSSRLSTTEELPSIAANRNVEPRKLTGLVRGDLDWIVMKCLEKDRKRRYETASAFAADLRHYLADEPVQASPPSPGYRFRKFARRNKGVFAVAVVGILAALLAIVVLTVSNRMITREKVLKETALADAIREKARADDNLAGARRAVKDYLLKTSDHPLLKSADFQDLRKSLLESALPFYEEFVRQAREDPILEAERGRAYQDLGELRRELGDQPRALDELARAEQIFQRLTDTNPDEPAGAFELAGTRIIRGVVLNELARFGEAERAFRRALAILGPLAAKDPRSDYRASLAQATSNLGELFRELGRGADAETMLRRAITLRRELLKEQPDSLAFRGQLAQSWINLGALFHANRRPDDARGAFEEAVALFRADTGRTEPVTSARSLRLKQVGAQALNNLGIIHREAGRPVEAETSSREALAIKQGLADTFPSVPQYRHELARSFNNLGTLLASLDRPEDARSAFEKAVGAYERLVAGAGALPLYSVELAGTYINLGRLIGDRGQLGASLPPLTKGIDILEAAYRKDSREVKVRESLLVAHWTRAMTLCGLGRYSPALADWGRALELDDGRYQDTLRVKRASNLLALKDHARAAADARAIAESRGATAEELFNAASVYAIAAGMAARDAAASESYADRALAVLRRAVAKGYKDLAHLQKASDLDVLRARQDFKQLLQELEERSGRPDVE